MNFKVILFLVLGLFFTQAIQAMQEVQAKGDTSCWRLADVGTLTNAARASRDLGEHAVTIGWNVIKIPLIPIKHTILQFIDLFCYGKNVIKHSGLAGFSFFKLGTDVVAAPFVYGYNYPKETAIVVTALIAAGAVFHGDVLLEELQHFDWDSIFHV